MGEVFSGTAAFDYLGHLNQFKNFDIFSMMEPIRAVPRSGLLFYQAAPFSAGGHSFPAGVYVVGGYYFGPSDIGFNTTRPFAPLARPTQGPYPDSFTDALVTDVLTQHGNLAAGTFGGTSATRVVDLSSYPGIGGIHTVSHWEITAVKNGTQLTGKITYYLEQWDLDATTCVPLGSLKCQVAFFGTIKWEFPFAAVRVQ